MSRLGNVGTVSIQLEVPSSARGVLLRAVATHLDKVLTRSVNGIHNGVKQVIGHAIEASPEYESLSGDRLWHELGVEHPEIVLPKIVQAIQEGVEVKNLGARVNGDRLDGGMVIRILRADLSEVLSLPEATFTSINRYGEVSNVDWLEWLLLGGEGNILAEFCYVPVPWAGSRTGLGIMRESKRGWSVPREFAGTRNDNWLTRALDAASEEFVDVIVQELIRNF